MNRSAVELAPDNETQTEVPVTASPSAWQVVGAVVRGVSHERLGMPCQDAEDYRVLPGGTLLVALADGAGSASFSDQGARCAVNEALHSLANLLEGGFPTDDAGWQRLIHDAFHSARAAVLALAQINAAEGSAPGELAAPEGPQEPEAQAAPEQPVVNFEPAVSEELPVLEDWAKAIKRRKPTERAYATTLTCVIATAGRLVVGQIGDGVVVAGEGEDLVAVTRLQRGEYANETHFLTQADALEQMEIAVIPQPFSALAVMSDGLVRLALKMPEQEPHAPFFRPLFRVTSAMAEPGGNLNETEAARQLSAFLSSERVNARTDDDKSLVLAVRTPTRRESGEPTLPEARTMKEGAERASSNLNWERK